METETIYSIHQYTFIESENKITHSSHETDYARNTIRKLMKDQIGRTCVFIVFNGCENDEKAYVFEDEKMLIVGSYDAFRAVEMIACWPFNLYNSKSLIDKLTKNLHREFLNQKDEDSNPF